MRLSIGKLGDRAGVNLETVRYYERIGLMPEPFRSDGGHRIYDETHLSRLSFIRRCRDLGFPLEDIRSLLDLAEAGDSCAELVPAADKQLALVRAKIEALKTMESALQGIRANAERCDSDACTVSSALFGCADCCPCCGTADLAGA
ncbi:MAG: MerR family transcriptional regulator [Alphaproteobacteria bacterium]|nr:MAG: MerR family transcriptional regulator [Alphaproteobacteria bacterium]